MGNIQNKRGGARQAPPQVYHPFYTDDDYDWSFVAAFYIVVIIMFSAGGIILLMIKHSGIPIEEWLDEK